MVDKKDITGIILAGGKSSRMGRDKGFLKLNGKPFIQYSIDALKPLVSEIIIVSDNTEYDVFGFMRINDLIKKSGPIAGIYAGLEASTTEHNLILSCDIPLINSDILKRLIDGIDLKSEIIQIESDGKTMPLIAIYKRQVKHTFNSFLKADERRLRVAIKSCRTKNIILDKAHEICTMNVNTQKELKVVEDAYKD